jgi:hypothetical protein
MNRLCKPAAAQILAFPTTIADDEVPSHLPSIAANGLFMLTPSPSKGYFMLTCIW